MPPKKTLDLKILVKTLLQEGLKIWACKKIPILGDAIEFAERLEMAHKMEAIFNEADSQADRIAMLEQLAAIQQAEMQQMIQALMPALDKKDTDNETQKFVTEWVAQIPQAVARKTSVTQKLSSSQSAWAGEDSFYLDLIPARRPHNWANTALPHRSPPWVLKRLLGFGGFGEVWLAQNKALQQEAIKFCHDAGRLAFLTKESSTLQRIQQQLANQPNIVQLKEIHLDPQKAPQWLAFEYVEGGDLLSLMQQRHLSWYDALILFKGIVTGVAAAHTLGFVHRDLKPANILLTAEGMPKVADFGLGRETNADKSMTTALGTAGYASPEQMLGSAKPSDDVYALGVIFWQLATHSLQASSQMELLGQVKISELPDSAKKLLLECLGKFEQRPKDAGVLLARVQQLPETLIHSPAALQKRLDADQKHLEAELKQQQALERQQVQQAQAVKQSIRDQWGSATDWLKQQLTQPQNLAADWAQLKSLRARVQEQKQQIDQQRQAGLTQLGPYNPPPRDEEFESKAEHQAKLEQYHQRYSRAHQAIQAQWDKTETEILGEIRAAIAALTQRRYAFVLNSLHDFKNTPSEDNPTQGVLTCQAELHEVLPTDYLAFNATTPIERQYAQHYREHPDWFSLEVMLALQETPGIVVDQAKLRIANQGQFDSAVAVEIKTDHAALARLAYAQAQQQNTIEAYQAFLKQCPNAQESAQATKQMQALQAEVHRERLAKEAATEARIAAERRAAISRHRTGQAFVYLFAMTAWVMLAGVAAWGLFQVPDGMVMAAKGTAKAFDDLNEELRGSIVGSIVRIIIYGTILITIPWWIIIYFCLVAIYILLSIPMIYMILPIFWLWASSSIETFTDYLSAGETLFWSYALYASLAQVWLVSQHTFTYSPTIAMTIIIGAFTLFLARLWHKAVSKE